MSPDIVVVIQKLCIIRAFDPEDYGDTNLAIEAARSWIKSHSARIGWRMMWRLWKRSDLSEEMCRHDTITPEECRMEL